MKESVFHIHANLEDTHWWFVGRRRIIERIVSRVMAEAPQDGAIVDVGCGTGGTVGALSAHFPCLGLDSSPLAIDYAKMKYPRCAFRLGVMPDDLLDLSAKASLYLLMDVLEHIEDDRSFLSRLVEVARPGAHILITVPAQPVLWSLHDETAGHLRRYDCSSLPLLWQGLPVQLRLLTAINYRLYPLIRLIRALGQLGGTAFGGGGTDFKQPLAPVNNILGEIFGGEAAAVEGKLDDPGQGNCKKGVSLIALLRKLPEGATAHV